MKIFVDTNVLISALVFKGLPLALLKKLLRDDHELFVSPYVVEEFKRILLKKWPEKYDETCENFCKMNFVLCPSSPKPLATLRDKKDIPVLSDAIFNRAQILLTGDKDFLGADAANPKILSPADFAKDVFLNE